MKKLMLTMLSVVGMMLFVALPAKACTSYYVGKDCTKDGTTMYGLWPYRGLFSKKG